MFYSNPQRYKTENSFCLVLVYLVLGQLSLRCCCWLLFSLGSKGGNRMDWIQLAVNGTLMRGLALEKNLLQVNGRFVKEARTEKCYRLWSIRDEYPAMVRVSKEDPQAVQVELEVWELPGEGLVQVLLQEPPGPLITLNILAHILTIASSSARQAAFCFSARYPAVLW